MPLRRNSQLPKSELLRTYRKAPAFMDQAKRRQVCDLIRKGVPIISAAHCAGVTEGQFNKWLANGKRLRDMYERDGRLPDNTSTDDYNCLSLYDTVEGAYHAGVKEMMGHITKGAKKDWRAAAWWLERRMATHFAAPETAAKIQVEASRSKLMANVTLYLPDNGRGKTKDTP